jgi:glycosyltransferase involved in cell wall biosynthesis
MGLNNADLPRTLIVDLAARYGGSCSRVISLLEHLPSGSAALAALDGAGITKRARSLGVPLFTVGSKKADPLIVPRLTRIIRNHGVRVVDTQNIQSKVWGSLAAAKTGTALISTLNSWYAEEHGARLKGRIYQIIEAATSRKIDLYIAVSQQILQSLLKAGVPRESIALVPNAVELRQPPAAYDRHWLVNKFGFPPKATVFCAVGRLEWVKGFEDLILAFSRLAARFPDLCGLVIGEGSLYANLSSLISRRGLQDRIQLAGFRQHEEVLSIVKASNIFVMPSRSEGTPVALLEAAALGRPILASRVGGIPDLVEDGEHALLTPPGDIEALADALARLCQDSELAQRLGKKAQKRVARDFTVQAQASATQQAYCKAWQSAQRRLNPSKNFTDTPSIKIQP